MNYHLALETILIVLAEMHSTGMLEAEVPAIAGNRTPARAIATLKYGKLSNCTIRAITNDHLLAEGKDAYQRIASTILRWRFTPVELSYPTQESPHTEPIPLNLSYPTSFSRPLPTPPQRWVARPRKLKYLPPRELQTWGTLHRKIYLLIDGILTEIQIAHLLQVTPEQVSEALQEMEQIGVTSLEKFLEY